MPSLSSLSDHRVYHILSYGTLLGTTFFHSFVGGVIAYQALPRAQFSRLMEKTFPYFFALQTALPLAMMVTYPGELVAQLGGEQAHINQGLGGLLAESNRWTALVPLVTILGTSLVNMLILGPATTRTMKTRHHQGWLQNASGHKSPLTIVRNPRWNEKL